MRVLGLSAVLLAGLVAGACGGDSSKEYGAEPRTASSPAASPASTRPSASPPLPASLSPLAAALLQPADLPGGARVRSVTPQTIDLKDQVRSNVRGKQLLAQTGVRLKPAAGGRADQAASCGDWARAGWPDLSKVRGVVRIYPETPWPFSTSLVGSTVVTGRPADLARVRRVVARCAELDVTLTKYKARGKVTQRVVALPKAYGDRSLAIEQRGEFPAGLTGQARQTADLFTGDAVFMVSGDTTVLVYVAGKAGVTARQLAQPAFQRATRALG